MHFCIFSTIARHLRKRLRSWVTYCYIVFTESSSHVTHTLGLCVVEKHHLCDSATMHCVAMYGMCLSVLAYIVIYCRVTLRNASVLN